MDFSVTQSHGTLVDTGAGVWVEGTPAIQFPNPSGLHLINKYNLVYISPEQTGSGH